MKRLDQMVSQGLSLEQRVCSNIITLFSREREETSVYWTPCARGFVPTICPTAQNILGGSSYHPILWVRNGGSQDSEVPKQRDKEAVGWTLRRRAPHFHTHCFPQQPMRPKPGDTWNMLPSPHFTYIWWKKSKMIRNRTGENSLKFHHLRNFLASLWSERITSFVAFICWVSGHSY